MTWDNINLTYSGESSEEVKELKEKVEILQKICEISYRNSRPVEINVSTVSSLITEFRAGVSLGSVLELNVSLHQDKYHLSGHTTPTRYRNGTSWLILRAQDRAKPEVTIDYIIENVQSLKF